MITFLIVLAVMAAYFAIALLIGSLFCRLVLRDPVPRFESQDRERVGMDEGFYR